VAWLVGGEEDDGDATTWRQWRQARLTTEDRLLPRVAPVFAADGVPMGGLQFLLLSPHFSSSGVQVCGQGSGFPRGGYG
jgi:hypothetical protein